MTWVKIDDNMPENLKIAPLSDAAFRAYVTAICYCARNLTDGFLPDRVAVGMAKKRAVVSELAPCLWEPVSGGYYIHDYLQYNYTRTQTLTHRASISAERSKAGSKGAAKRWQTPWQNDGPVPDPDPITKSEPPTAVNTQRS